MQVETEKERRSKTDFWIAREFSETLILGSVLLFYISFSHIISATAIALKIRNRQQQQQQQQKTVSGIVCTFNDPIT